MSEPLKGRPTACFIDHAALRWNLARIRSRIGARVKILSMVKANGYGHDAAAVAQTLAAAGSDAFGVATLEEGEELRRAGVRTPIIILAGVYPEQVQEFLDHRLTPVVHDVERLGELDQAAAGLGETLAVHVKIDTGMGRLGLLPAEKESWIPQLGKLQALKIEGVFSHFSQAESVDGAYTRKQLEIFTRVLDSLRAAGLGAPLTHLANSAATLTLPAAHFDMVRPGLALYGIYPSPAMAAEVDLKPVLTWKTRILQLKRVPAGTPVSYGQTFVTARESVIATLPVGYADGYPRLLSNRGRALAGGQAAPVVGRVCMDLTMLDVTDIRNVRQGDEVVLLGRQGDAAVSADEMASWADTISYEILTSIGARVPRIHENL